LKELAFNAKKVEGLKKKVHQFRKLDESVLQITEFASTLFT
jgi:hypothetical protein